MCIAIFAGLLIGLICPLAGDNIIRLAAAIHQIERDCSKLSRRAAL